MILGGCNSMPVKNIYLLRDKPYLIVSSIEMSGDSTYGKYRYKADEYIFYLDEKYNIGDTLWIGKKQ